MTSNTPRGKIVEYSTDGGLTWTYGTALEGWAAQDASIVNSKRADVRNQVADNGRGVRTRLIDEEI